MTWHGSVLTHKHPGDTDIELPGDVTQQLSRDINPLSS